MNYWENLLSVRTAINSGWVILSVFILIIFLQYVLNSKNGIFSGRKLSLSNEIALAICVYFVGTLLVRVWNVLLLFGQRYNFTKFVWDSYPISVAGSLLAFVGGLWLIKIFSPEKWRPFGWIFSAIASLIISWIVAYFNT